MMAILVFMTCNFAMVDFANNKNHSARLKDEGMFDQAVIVNGSAIYYDETMSLIEHIDLVAPYYGKPDKDFQQNFLDEYVETLYPHIIKDPTSFSRDLRMNKFRPSYWMMKSKANALERRFREGFEKPL